MARATAAFGWVWPAAGFHTWRLSGGSRILVAPSNTAPQDAAIEALATRTCGTWDWGTGMKVTVGLVHFFSPSGLVSSTSTQRVSGASTHFSRLVIASFAAPVLIWSVTSVSATGVRTGVPMALRKQGIW